MPSIRNGLANVGGVASVGMDGLMSLRRINKFPFREFIDQCWFLAKVTSLPVIMVSIPFGVIIALHVGTFSRQLGAESHIGAAMVRGVVREEAPLATALLIAGAGGSAIAADLGSRRIRDELSAMQVMGVDPIHRLVLPRLLAAVVVAMLLDGIVSAAGIIGGWVMAVPVQKTTTGAYFASFNELAVMTDFFMAIIKAVIFGYVAAAIACHYGLNADGGPKGVGQAVNRSVVLTFVALFFLNMMITAIYFNIVPPKL